MNYVSDPSVARRSRRGGQRIDVVSTRRNIYDSILLALMLAGAVAGVVMFGAVRVWSIGIMLCIVFSCSALFLSRSFFNQELRIFKIPPGLLCLVAFFAYVFIQSFVVPVRDDALFDALSVGGVAASFFVWTGVSARVGRWRLVFAVFLFAISLVCWYALIQHVHGSNGVLMMARPQQYGMRASGTYMCPNHYANLLEIILCLCVGLILLPSAGAWLRILSGYTAAMALPILLLTQSRSGWLGSCAGMTLTALLIVWRRSKKWFFILLVGIPLLVGGTFSVLWFSSPMFRERVSGASMSSPDGAVQIRFIMWNDTLQMIKAAPLWGHGGGSFRWIYPHYKTHDEQLWARYPHNEFLQALAEYGWVGSGILLVGGVIIVWRFLRVVFVAERERDAALSAIALGAFAACLVHGVFDFNFHIYANVLVLTMLAGVAASCNFASGCWQVRTCARMGWWLIYGILALLCMAGAVQSGRMALSYYYTKKGWEESRTFKQEEAIKHYHRAYTLDPLNWRPLLGIGGIYRGKAFWDMDLEMKKKYAEKALAIYDRALALNPYEIETEYCKSTIYRSLGDSDTALDSLQTILTFSPNDVFILNKAGIELRLAGQLDDAQNYFERAKMLGGGRETDINLNLIRKAKAQ